MPAHVCPNGECWRPVPGFSRYSASCTGKIRSFVGRVPRDLAPRWSGRVGHQKVLLRRDCVTFDLYIHRLVVEAFVGPIAPGLVVRHINDIPGDNRLANLETGTPKQNSQDRIRNGNHGTKLTEAEARQILALRTQGLTYAAIGARVGVTRGQACHICLGHSWAHLQPAATATP